MASGGGKRKLGQNKRKPTNIAYKQQDRYSRNKKRRALRHSKRMDAQICRVMTRHWNGKTLSTKTRNKCLARDGIIGNWAAGI